MNRYLNREIHKENLKVVEIEEDNSNEIIMVIAAATILVIAMYLMKINVYDVIFRGIDAMNLAFRDMSAFLSGLAGYLHLNEMVNQITQLF